MKHRSRRVLVLAALLGLLTSVALAAAPDSPPITNWMTTPVTSIAEKVRSNAIFITLMVLPYFILPQVLLFYCIFKFREGGGRKPATFHENLKLEVFWTVIPALTLVVLAYPSYHLLKMIENPPPADEHITIVGHQFFWSYEYPEYGVTISDKPLVVPEDKVIVADITSVDVIHSWWVPSFGVKMDAVPGRVSNIWFKINDAGQYKGQCAELCGALHSKMLIDVTAVPPDEFKKWIAAQQAAMAVVDEEEDKKGSEEQPGEAHP